MEKDPAEQCKKLVSRLTKAMIDSRLVAFTPHYRENDRAGRIVFWQLGKDIHLIEIDFYDFEDSKEFTVKLSEGTQGKNPLVQHGKATKLSGSYEDEEALMKNFRKWLKKNFRPRNISQRQPETNRLSP